MAFSRRRFDLDPAFGFLLADFVTPPAPIRPFLALAENGNSPYVKTPLCHEALCLAGKDGVL